MHRLLGPSRVKIDAFPLKSSLSDLMHTSQNLQQSLLVEVGSGIHQIPLEHLVNAVARPCFPRGFDSVLSEVEPQSLHLKKASQVISDAGGS